MQLGMATASNCPEVKKDANSPAAGLEVGVLQLCRTRSWCASWRESLVGRHEDADERKSLETMLGVKQESCNTRWTPQQCETRTRDFTEMDAVHGRRTIMDCRVDDGKGFHCTNLEKSKTACLQKMHKKTVEVAR